MALAQKECIMNIIDFFKLQSKNLFKDYKTRTPDPEDPSSFIYKPRYFDIWGLIIDYDIDEENFTHMTAQHYIALLAGFRKWNDLLKASETELELAKLLFDNMHKVTVDEWEMYISGTENTFRMHYDPEMRLTVFQAVFVEEEGHMSHQDYRLKKVNK